MILVSQVLLRGKEVGKRISHLFSKAPSHLVILAKLVQVAGQEKRSSLGTKHWLLGASYREISSPLRARRPLVLLNSTGPHL